MGLCNHELRLVKGLNRGQHCPLKQRMQKHILAALQVIDRAVL